MFLYQTFLLIFSENATAFITLPFFGKQVVAIRLFPSSLRKSSPLTLPIFVIVTALQYLSVATSQDLISSSSESLVFGVYAATDKFFDTVRGDLDQPSSSPPPMASEVVSNDRLYMNMTLSELISMFREPEAEKTELIGSCSCKDCHLRQPQKPLEVEKKKVGLWVRKGGSFRDGNVKRERKTEIEESVRKIKVEVELKEKSKRGKEAKERHETEKGLLRKSLEDTRKREEEQDKTIKRLRKENCKLMEENLRNEGIWTRKFEDLIERVLSLRNDVEMLKKEREKEASRTNVQG
ncbi:uncharacterized protein G2W53_027718 [Senna tora]|uniref:Uncharacterized protein n=1 Tax=Senna tora TaxID=362788 RepID=A0A834THM8_9FABA|nr:uncharacterized protein G2W53_027718 [Senna tora]